MVMPRKHPPGAGPRIRNTAARARLKERGGRLVQLALEADEIAALEALKAAGGYESDRAAIVAAIRAAVRLS